ncbi:MAG: AAA domain-containing protein, partial [Leptolinea sp.]|nr:AAA domain-containing protein [Leptolinea sp.]
SDARGHKVDFRNAIIVMTSNIGADMIKRQSSLGFTLTLDEAQKEQEAYDEMRKKLLDSLKRVFRPEFINRLDNVIVFRALAREHIRQIVTLEIEKVAERLVENEIALKASDPALDKLSEEGYDPDMGARPLRRVIQQKVEDPLSDALLSNDFGNGDVIVIDLNADGDVILRKEMKKKKAKQPEEKVEEPVV